MAWYLLLKLLLHLRKETIKDTNNDTISVAKVSIFSKVAGNITNKIIVNPS